MGSVRLIPIEGAADVPERPWIYFALFDAAGMKIGEAAVVSFFDPLEKGKFQNVTDAVDLTPGTSAKYVGIKSQPPVASESNPPLPK